MFFKSKANLPDAEKARIEYHFQQIAECIGFDRLKLPVLSLNQVLSWSQSKQSTDQMVRLIGDHLGYDTSGLRVNVMLQQPEQCGGGG